MAERCAIVGIGISDHKRIRADLSMPGLLREAATRALADAEMDWDDIDAVVFGKAPDQFEGVMMPELFLSDSMGAAGKPMIRMHTAGSVGAHTAIFGAHLIESGLFESVLAVAFEKQSETNTARILGGGSRGGAGVAFAPSINEYIQRSGAPAHVGPMVAVKDRLNALKNPHAQLKIPDITVEKVMESDMVIPPLRRLECCPTSDGAGAIIFTSENRVPKTERPPAWLHASATRTEAMGHPSRSWVSPLAGQLCAQDVYKQAGITKPIEEIDAAEIYVPFSWFEPMWLENLGIVEENKGWELTESGATSLEGSFPVNPSGGVLSANAIGAAGLIRCAEAAMQVRGTAGEHQVDGARKALGHAYGGGSNYFAMWIVGADKP
jgi:acetyl-CoA C-acetyltransferase